MSYHHITIPHPSSGGNMLRMAGDLLTNLEVNWYVNTKLDKLIKFF